MFKGLITLFLLSLIGGCVTVESENTSRAFNPIKAADARIDLGMNYLQLGNKVKAKQNLDRALEYAPHYARVSSSMAYYYDLVKEPKTAESWYQRALSLQSDNGDVLNNYGVFLCRQKRFSAAQQQFNQAIQLTNYYSVAMSYENAGLCAVIQGDTLLARTYLVRAVAHDSSRIQSQIELIRVLIQLEEYERARQQLSEVELRFGWQEELQVLQQSLNAAVH